MLRADLPNYVKTETDSTLSTFIKLKPAPHERSPRIVRRRTLRLQSRTACAMQWGKAPGSDLIFSKPPKSRMSELTAVRP
jgi:hypothetical protein